jgi:hypothetical protein
MSRKIPLRRKATSLFSEVGREITDKIFENINCQKFNIFNASPSLDLLFGDIDKEKVETIYHINSLDSLKKDNQYYINPDEIEAVDQPKNIRGAVAFFDAREKPEEFPNYVKDKFAYASHIVTFLKDVTYLPYNEKYWHLEKMSVEGYNIQVLRTKETKNSDCQKNIDLMNDVNKDLDEFIEDIIKEKKEAGQTQKPPPPPPPPPVQQTKTKPPRAQPQPIPRPVEKTTVETGVNFREALMRLIQPTIIPKEQRGEPFSETWLKYYRDYIRDVINMLYPSIKPALLDLLTTPEMMIHWIPVIVHISYNPNTGQNFEQFESIGDQILGAQFKKFVTIREPKITEAQLNERKARYMGREFQHHIGKRMCIDEWLLTLSSTVTDAMLEDLFEAFCGALQKIGDLAFNTGGMGDLLIMKVIETLFGNMKFDARYDYGNDQTIVDQISETWRFTASGKSQTDEFEDQSGKYFRTTYRFTGQAFYIFMKSFEALIPDYDISRIPTEIVAEGFSPYKNVSKANAATKMLQKLEEYGITRALVKYTGASRNKYYYTDVEYHDLVNQILLRIKGEKYDEIIFKAPKNASTNTRRLILLIATHKDDKGDDKVIKAYEFPQVERGVAEYELNDQKELMRMYLSS